MIRKSGITGILRLMPLHTRVTPVAVKMPACGVFAFQSAHAPGFEAQRMEHPFWKLLLIRSGRGRLHLPGGCEPFSAGDLLVLPIRQLHRLEDDAAFPAALVGVCFADELLTHGPEIRSHLHRAVLRLTPLLHREAHGWLRQMLYEQAACPTGHQVMLCSLVQRLIARLARWRQTRIVHRDTSSARVSEFADRLSESFVNARGIDWAAASVGLRRRRFTSLFRLVTGESYTEHLRRLRVDHAKHLLRQTGESLHAIAFICGFGDLSSFYRAFAACGEPPPARHRR